MNTNRNFRSSNKALVHFVVVTGIAVFLVFQLAMLGLQFADPGETETLELIPAQDNEYFYTTTKKEDVTNWNQYHYHPIRFQESISQWRSEHPMQYRVLVVLSEPSSPHVSSQSFVRAIRDALSSETTQVVVYLHRQSDPLTLPIIETEFQSFLRKKQLVLLTSSDKLPVELDHATATYGVRDDFFTAYMLDLSYQSKSDFTMVVRCCGLHLTNASTNEHHDYATVAVDQYLAIEKDWEESVNITDRLCWTLLYDNSDNPSSAYDAILLNTSEHASRLSVTLRSSLPYNFFRYSDILNIYCKNFIWSGTIIPGPALFSSELTSEIVWRNSVEQSRGLMDQGDPRRPYETTYSIESEQAIIDPQEFGVPDWTDSTLQLGPRLPRNHSPPPFQIAFAASAMIRPTVQTKYLEKFINELLQLMETNFPRSPDGNTTTSDEMQGQPPLAAVIVLLVSGTSLEEMASLRGFLETRYADAIERGVVQLTDAPWEGNAQLLRHRRSTYPDDTPARRDWRAQQNLDLGALLAATVGLSDFVLLLEDDVGFHQRDFVHRLKQVMRESVRSPPLWARADFGFGYAGVLLRGMDVPVYEHMHQTFFDEKPCDILGLHDLVRSGYYIHVGEYLSHLGLYSSLAGKTQVTFIHG
jgi:N-Acetylglucosaminyltransferase-IV (GnT-IV) conserved region